VQENADSDVAFTIVVKKEGGDEHGASGDLADTLVDVTQDAVNEAVQDAVQDVPPPPLFADQHLPPGEQNHAILRRIYRCEFEGVPLYSMKPALRIVSSL